MTYEHNEHSLTVGYDTFSNKETVAMVVPVTRVEAEVMVSKAMIGIMIQ